MLKLEFIFIHNVLTFSAGIITILVDFGLLQDPDAVILLKL